jgi:hypothetical protein
LTRYENAKGESVIEYLSAEARSQELEQIGHEEDGLKVLRALEAEGWMKVLFPAWTVAKADEDKLKALHDLAVELQMQGVHPDMSAAQMQLLTAKLAAKDLTALKKLMLRPGFVEEWNSLDSLAAGFAKVLLSKANATPSASFKLFTSYDPEAILWLGFTSKDAAVRGRFDQFLKVWPEAKQRTPHLLMQEMRITPELATYREIVQAIFLELIDGRLTTPEEMRAFLEPHSPPAPPPQVTIKRPRAKRGAEAKVKERAYDDDEDGAEEETEHDDLVADDDEVDLGMNLPKVELDLDIPEELEPAEDEADEDEPEPVEKPVKRGGKPAKEAKPAKGASVPAPAKAAKPELKSAPQAKIAPPQASTKAGPAPTKTAPAKAVPVASQEKTVPAPIASKTSGATKTAAKAPVKAAVKPAVKPVAKASAKAAAKPVVKALAKKLVKPLAKSHGKAAAKATLKSPAKSNAGSGAKGKPAKGKPAASSKAGKASHGAKPSKPAAKKPAPKSAKRR